MKLAVVGYPINPRIALTVLTVPSLNMVLDTRTMPNGEVFLFILHQAIATPVEGEVVEHLRVSHMIEVHAVRGDTEIEGSITKVLTTWNYLGAVIIMEQSHTIITMGNPQTKMVPVFLFWSKRQEKQQTV